MRKVLLVLSVLALLTTAVATATAQDQITLGASSNSMTFTGDGSGDWTLTFAGGAMTGAAFGTGILTSGPTSYSITQGAVTIAGTTTGIPNYWTISQSGPLTFCYGGCGASSLLEGNLQLVNLNQTPGIAIGDFNDTLTVNLTNLTGSLVTSGAMTTQGKVDITIIFATTTDLQSLPMGGTLVAGISSGEVRPTPEPVSMALVGSGLILLGALVRRRRTGR
jgi:hypothetical protein